ncbi:MAG: sigma-70 family RNA polymerase sigma factor [Pikeienuella sp.]|uniref:sigma-70 family RNA polymerase sigma factor n=1 Tax=Pikeienuella sp. TaxID=2831957 RepID=UPI00391D8615
MEHEGAGAGDAALRERRWSSLMNAARAGDRAAYARLLAEVAEALRPPIRARLARLGFDAAHAEDALQETLIALHEKGGTWDGRRPITPWIRAIARHKALDLARRLGRARARTADAPVEDWAERIAAEEAAAPAPAEAAHLVAALPRRERGVVSALGLEGLDVAAAAARLGMSEGAVRVAFHRGLARLRARAERA